MRILLKNTSNLGDVEITDGIITSIGEDRNECEEEIDCTDQIIWPGLIDSHVHFRTPGQEYKEDWITGSEAALAGGITSVVDMPNNLEPILKNSQLDEKREIIDKQTKIEFKLALGVTDDSMADFQQAEENADAIKLFMGASTGNMCVSKSVNLEKIFRNTTKPLMIHAEDESIIRKNEQSFKEEQEPEVHSAIRGREAAIVAVSQALSLAKEFNREIYLCHVSTKEEIELVKEARAAGIIVHVEVTPHHLFLNKNAYQELGNYVKVNPPLRLEADNDALWDALKNGVISVVGSDHAPHTAEEKERNYWEAPAGIPGIELLFPLLLTAVNEGKISLNDVKRCCIENPAKIFGFNKKIEVGKSADIVVFDPVKEWVIKKHDLKTKCGWTPFEEYRMQGKVTFTYKHIKDN
ncbi:MAG: dihydroorotase family protein [bacterium]|nr:dihydroorotase family protein [bacterium]